MFEEYPKALYKAGAHTIVQDAAEEKAQRADGFTDWHTDHAATQPDADAEPAALTRDQMKAKADELGLTYKHNISNTALAELIAAAQ